MSIVTFATPADLNAAGRELYEHNANRVKPAWDDLGDYTKGVWCQYALDGRTVDDLPVSLDTLDAALDDDF